MYTYHSKIRYSELDSCGVLSIGSLIDYFQDCSTFQSEELGVGVDALHHNHHVWLMNAWQVVLSAPARLCQNVAVSTWAHDFKGFYGYRNFVMKDEAGLTLAYANSIWVYVDTNTGHPCRCPSEITSVYLVEPPYPMEPAPRKIELPKESDPLPSLAVLTSDLDTNQHVNNGAYVRMASDCLPNDFTYHQMRAEYKNSAKLGDTIYPRRGISGGCCKILLSDAACKPYAVVEFS